VILVTGASGGIGAEVAVQAAAAGAMVAVGYRSSREAAQQVVARIHAAGGTAQPFGADLAIASRARDVVARVERRMGPIDGVVTAAALMDTGGFLDLDTRAWERILRNDLLSVVLTCQAVLPGMLERSHGAIVTFTSRLAEAGSAEAAHYAAAKAAVVSLTRSLALAYGPRGVRVNAVAPGTTDTAMGHDVIDSPAGWERTRRIPLRRFVEPREVAAVAVFLLTDAAAGIVGQSLQVNGGELMT
jgi:3-oxoacyl-[acyl-carrier protein] reductase